jgi:hypothetical protein
MKKTETPTDYTKFSYKEDAKVIMPGAVFTSLLNLLTHLNDDERKTFWTMKPTPEEMFSDENKPLVYLTEKGMALSDMLGTMFVVHQDNTDAGVATSIEELSKPQLEIVK